MERFEGLTTEDLINEIVLHRNNPLPGYDVKNNCFVTMVLVPKSQLKPGMPISAMYHGQSHLTYREGCIRIIIDSEKRDRIDAAASEEIVPLKPVHS